MLRSLTSTRFSRFRAWLRHLNVCLCGHPHHPAHDHYTRGSYCAFCGCPQFRPRLSRLWSTA